MSTNCRTRLRRAPRTQSRLTWQRASAPRTVSQTKTASVARPGHQQAQPLGVALTGISLSNFSAADDQQPAAYRKQLVEVARNQQHRAARGCELENRAM